MWHYSSFGDGFLVILLHGQPTDRRSMIPRFEPTFDRLSGYRRLYPDLPGMGKTRSSHPIPDLDAYVEELAAFVEAERKGQPVALVGASFGGLLALAFAVRYPDRVAGLALTVPAIHTDPVEPAQAIATEPGLLEGLSPSEAKLVAAAAAVRTRETADTLIRDVLAGRSSADEAFLAPILKTAPALRERLKSASYAGPSLFVAGRQDGIAGYVEIARMAEHFPRATSVVLDRAGHAAAIEQGPLVRSLVAEWLARVRESRGGRYGG